MHFIAEEWLEGLGLAAESPILKYILHNDAHLLQKHTKHPKHNFIEYYQKTADTANHTNKYDTKLLIHPKLKKIQRKSILKRSTSHVKHPEIPLNVKKCRHGPTLLSGSFTKPIGQPPNPSNLLNPAKVPHPSGTVHPDQPNPLITDPPPSSWAPADSYPPGPQNSPYHTPNILECCEIDNDRFLPNSQVPLYTKDFSPHLAEELERESRSVLTEMAARKESSQRFSFTRAQLGEGPAYSSESELQDHFTYRDNSDYDMSSFQNYDPFSGECDSNSNTGGRFGGPLKFGSASSGQRQTGPVDLAVIQNNPELEAGNFNIANPDTQRWVNEDWLDQADLGPPELFQYGRYEQPKTAIDSQINRYESTVDAKKSQYQSMKRGLEHELQRPEVLQLFKKYYPEGSSFADDILSTASSDNFADDEDEQRKREAYRQKVESHYRRLLEEGVMSPEAECLNQSWSSQDLPQRSSNPESPSYQTGINESDWKAIDHHRSLSLEKSEKEKFASGQNSLSNLPSAMKHTNTSNAQSPEKKKKKVRVRRHDSLIKYDSEPDLVGKKRSELQLDLNQMENVSFESNTMDQAPLHVNADSLYQSEADLYKTSCHSKLSSRPPHSGSLNRPRSTPNLASSPKRQRPSLVSPRSTASSGSESSGIPWRMSPKQSPKTSPKGSPKRHPHRQVSADDFFVSFRHREPSESSDRSSRIDPQTYQSYAAGILHSSRKSEQFLRLQNHYATLERITEIEESTLMNNEQKGRKKFNSVSLKARSKSMGNLGPDIDNILLSKYKLENLEELWELYADLYEAQKQEEFFYDNGNLEGMQWNPWRDPGLKKKYLYLEDLYDIYERGQATMNTFVNRKKQRKDEFQRELSFKKLCNKYQHLDEASRRQKILEDWWSGRSHSRRGSDASSVMSGASTMTTGSYIQIMENAAKKAKERPMYGYNIHEEPNRYEIRIEKIRKMSKSCPNISALPLHVRSESQPQLGSKPNARDRLPSRSSSYKHSMFATDQQVDESRFYRVKNQPKSSGIQSQAWNPLSGRNSESGYDSIESRSPNSAAVAHRTSVAQTVTQNGQKNAAAYNKIHNRDNPENQNNRDQRPGNTSMSGNLNEDLENRPNGYGTKKRSGGNSLYQNARYRPKVSTIQAPQNRHQNPMSREDNIDYRSMKNDPNISKIREENFRQRQRWRKDSKPNPGAVASVLSLFETSDPRPPSAFNPVQSSPRNPPSYDSLQLSGIKDRNHDTYKPPLQPLREEQPLHSQKVSPPAYSQIYSSDVLHHNHNIDHNKKTVNPEAFHSAKTRFESPSCTQPLPPKTALQKRSLNTALGRYEARIRSKSVEEHPKRPKSASLECRPEDEIDNSSWRRKELSKSTPSLNEDYTPKFNGRSSLENDHYKKALASFTPEPGLSDQGAGLYNRNPKSALGKKNQSEKRMYTEEPHQNRTQSNRYTERSAQDSEADRFSGQPLNKSQMKAVTSELQAQRKQPEDPVYASVIKEKRRHKDQGPTVLSYQDRYQLPRGDTNRLENSLHRRPRGDGTTEIHAPNRSYQAVGQQQEGQHRPEGADSGTPDHTGVWSRGSDRGHIRSHPSQWEVRQLSATDRDTGEIQHGADPSMHTYHPEHTIPATARVAPIKSDTAATMRLMNHSAGSLESDYLLDGRPFLLSGHRRSTAAASQTSPQLKTNYPNLSNFRKEIEDEYRKMYELTKQAAGYGDDTLDDPSAMDSPKRTGSSSVLDKEALYTPFSGDLGRWSGPHGTEGLDHAGEDDLVGATLPKWGATEWLSTRPSSVMTGSNDTLIIKGSDPDLSNSKTYGSVKHMTTSQDPHHLEKSQSEPNLVKDLENTDSPRGAKSEEDMTSEPGMSSSHFEPVRSNHESGYLSDNRDEYMPQRGMQRTVSGNLSEIRNQFSTPTNSWSGRPAFRPNTLQEPKDALNNNTRVNQDGSKWEVKKPTIHPWNIVRPPSPPRYDEAPKEYLAHIETLGQEWEHEKTRQRIRSQANTPENGSQQDNASVNQNGPVYNREATSPISSTISSDQFVSGASNIQQSSQPTSRPAQPPPYVPPPEIKPSQRRSHPQYNYSTATVSRPHADYYTTPNNYAPHSSTGDWQQMAPMPAQPSQEAARGPTVSQSHPSAFTPTRRAFENYTEPGYKLCY